MEIDNRLSMLLLSCDAYYDLWDNFFNLQERFWPDCRFKWYVVTESKDYNRKGVSVIKCGKELNWAGRLRYAVEAVNSPYISFILDDNYINAPVNNDHINFLLSFVFEHNVDYLDLGNVFRHKIDIKEKSYYAEDLIIIPKHLRYGIDTAAAIWDKNYLLAIIGEGDYSAWKFETNMCEVANSQDGYSGLILVDERLSLNITPIPVVIQGKYYPDAIKDFKKRSYIINTGDRPVMTTWECFKYKLKCKVSKFPYFHNSFKKIGRVLGYKFFTE